MARGGARGSITAAAHEGAGAAQAHLRGTDRTQRLARLLLHGSVARRAAHLDQRAHAALGRELLQGGGGGPQHAAHATAVRGRGSRRGGSGGGRSRRGCRAPCCRRATSACRGIRAGRQGGSGRRHRQRLTTRAEHRQRLHRPARCCGGARLRATRRDALQRRRRRQHVVVAVGVTQQRHHDLHAAACCDAARDSVVRRQVAQRCCRRTEHGNAPPLRGRGHGWCHARRCRCGHRVSGGTSATAEREQNAHTADSNHCRHGRCLAIGRESRHCFGCARHRRLGNAGQALTVVGSCIAVLASRAAALCHSFAQ
jgi:hypothetical protein